MAGAPFHGRFTHDRPKRSLESSVVGRSLAGGGFDHVIIIIIISSFDCVPNRILPGLIRGVETAARSVGTASPVTCGVRVLVYNTAAALLSPVGEPFLAWAVLAKARGIADRTGEANHMGTAFGPVVGAVLLLAVPQAITFLNLPPGIMAPMQGILFTLLVLVFLFVRPAGIMGVTTKVRT